MEGVKQRAVKAKELLVQVKQKLTEVQTQSAQAKTSSTTKEYSSGTVGWDRGANSASTANSRSIDSLEAEFQKWEIDEELERIKKNL
jgi:hypothetical protein